MAQGLANVFFGGNLLTAQVMLTLFVTVLLIFPALMARAKPDVVVLMGFFAVIACTMVGWLPPGVMIFIVAFMALLYAGVVRKAIGG